MKKVNVGIIGCGGVSDVHVKSLTNNKDCQVVSVCDLIEDRASSLANKYNISKTYTDHSLMLKNEQLDLIHVLTPPQSHAKLVIDSMNSGCNVLVEKPMCMTVKEADLMIESAKENDVTLGVVHSYLYTPGIREALRLVKNGDIGDLLHVDALISIEPLRGWFDTDDDYPGWYYTLQGALFGEILAHGFYLQLGFLGKVQKIHGITTEAEQPTRLVPISELKVLMECENGSGSMLVSSRIKSYHAIPYIRVIGTKKMLTVTIPTATVIKNTFRGPEKRSGGYKQSLSSKLSMNLEPASQLITKTISNGVKYLAGSIKLEMSHQLLIDEYISNLNAGIDPPVTAEEGREVIKATNLLWENIL